MNFYAAFGKVVWSRPAAAFGALYWHLTGRKLRAKNRLRIRLEQGPQAYSIWIENIERRADVLSKAPAKIRTFPRRPLLSIIRYLREGCEQDDLDAVIAMMRCQAYLEWEVIIVLAPDAPRLDLAGEAGFRTAKVRAAQGCEALCIGVQEAKGDYLLPLAKGSVLPPTALYHYAQAILAHPTVAMVFGDNDWINRQGIRYRPWFKPEWNSELALSQDFFSQAFLVSRSATSDAIHDGLDGDAEAAYALALAVGTARPSDVLHIPYIQSHLYDTETVDDHDARRSVVQAHLDREAVEAIASKGAYGTIRVDWPLPCPLPLVSIIIPTRDKVELLRACISGLLARTSYSPFEILIVDNGSTQESARSYLKEIAGHSAVRISRDDHPYNFSRLNNLAVAKARGSYLCLLNNDTEIIDGDWLTAMVRQATRPLIGAVGAKLLYADGSIQHAGVVIGLNDGAGHAHRFQLGDDPGYFARVHAAHYVSAVTAACLVVSKEKYLAVGGLDEDRLAIAFNDVDLCLKLRACGLHNVYSPYAVLLHHESKSRGRLVSSEHIDRFQREWRTLQERWQPANFIDPLHHPHLDRTTESYLIRL